MYLKFERWRLGTVLFSLDFKCGLKINFRDEGADQDVG